jgi:hypothetical protein
LLIPPGGTSLTATTTIDYPTVELARQPDGSFAATTDRFSEEGAYQIRVFAKDNQGAVSVPILKSLAVGNPLRRRAVVAVLGTPADPRIDSFLASGDYVVAALTRQGYGPSDAAGSGFATDETFYLRPGAYGTGGADDGTPTLADLQAAIVGFAADNARDAVVYLTGERNAGGLRVNTSETLTPAQLDGWLDALQGSVAGPITVIIDCDDAGAFIAQMAPPAGKLRVVITSTQSGEQAVLQRTGRISFTRALFSAIQSGVSLRSAYFSAASALAFKAGNIARPMAQIDDTGNGVANEELIDALEDGLAGRTRLGNGLLTAGDPPFAASMTVATSLSGQATAQLEVSGVYGTASVAEVTALLRSPSGATSEFVLDRSGAASFGGLLNCLATETGTYSLSVYARDGNGALSQPLRAEIVQNATAVPGCALLGPIFKDGFE